MGWLENTLNDPVRLLVTAGTAGGAAPYYQNQDEKKRIEEEQKKFNEQYGVPAQTSERETDLQRGYARGQKEFYDDPDMQNLRARREDLAKGYDGQELGALREQSRMDLEGQRSKYLNQLQSNLGRGGVGGARRAAMVGASNQGFAANRAANERAINIDQAKQIRQGTNDLQDFYMRQKYGKMSTGLGEAELGVADRTAAANAAIAGREPKKGLLTDFMGGLF